jgi:hypothetical protein
MTRLFLFFALLVAPVARASPWCDALLSSPGLTKKERRAAQKECEAKAAADAAAEEQRKAKEEAEKPAEEWDQREQLCLTMMMGPNPETQAMGAQLCRDLGPRPAPRRVEDWDRLHGLCLIGMGSPDEAMREAAAQQCRNLGPRPFQRQ